MRFTFQRWKPYLAGLVSGVGLGLTAGVSLVEAGLLGPGQKTLANVLGIALICVGGVLFQFVRKATEFTRT